MKKFGILFIMSICILFLSCGVKKEYKINEEINRKYELFQAYKDSIANYYNADDKFENSLGETFGISALIDDYIDTMKRNVMINCKIVDIYHIEDNEYVVIFETSLYWTSFKDFNNVTSNHSFSLYNQISFIYHIKISKNEYKELIINKEKISGYYIFTLEKKFTSKTGCYKTVNEYGSELTEDYRIIKMYGKMVKIIYKDDI